MNEKRNVCSILVWKSERKIALDRPKLRQKDETKIDLTEI